MDPSVIEARILETLTHAMDHARQGRAHVERQQQILEGLKRGGHDTILAASLLQTLQEAQALHEEGVRKLEQELAAFRGDKALSEQSRLEMRHRVEGLKEAKILLSSSADTIEESRSLLGKLLDAP